MSPLFRRARRASHGRFTTVVPVVVVCLALTWSAASATDATIGLYSDNSGYSCSLSADGLGFVTAYVVVRPGSTGIRDVRFSAPLPACFQASFLAETAPGVILVSGSSPSGISLTSVNCETEPFYALQIFYMATGTTAPCCDFPILADPSVGTLEATDCANNTIPLLANMGRVNADATCPCGTAVVPPSTPSNPSPPDGVSSQPAGGTELSCSVSDPNGLPMTYDLYFGASPNPPLAVSNIATTGTVIFNPGTLSFLTTYYWKVVVRNPTLAEASGPVWSFTTSANRAPTVGTPSPANGASKIFTNTTVAWVGIDPDGLPLSYDVYFGTNASPPLVASNIFSQLYPPGALAFSTQYFWRVVAHEVGGGIVSSPTWSFTTKASNEPPGTLTNTSPPNGATNRAFNTTLEWQCSDFEGLGLTYDVYFGTSSNPPKIVTNQDNPYYFTHALQELTQYYWHVVARDGGGLESAGPTWSFTTKVNLAPSTPSNPNPADNSTNHGTNITLQWGMSTDPEEQLVNYDVYFGASDPPALVATNVGYLPRYSPAGVQYSTTYFWRVVARDESGGEASGPTWKFTTRNNSPPTTPSPTLPVAGQPNFPNSGDLRWTCSDPDPFQTLAFDVYFGTATNPPLVRSGQTSSSFSSVMLVSTTYYWRVVARDPEGAQTSGPVWSFTTGAGSNQAPLVPSNPSPPHMNLLAPRNPVLKWNSGDPDGNQLLYSITVWSDSPYEYYHENTYMPQLAMTNLTKNVIYSWKVDVTDGAAFVYGPVWWFHVQGGMVPVLFSSFDATRESGGVRVQWKLSSDESMDGFTLYRQDGTGPSRVINEGKVAGDHGAYLDETAEPGKTYQYELVIRTLDGDEFRSQPATVSMPVAALTLHQNVPNPFNPQTTIGYDLPADTYVRLSIYDTSGRRVRTLLNENQIAGSRSAMWNGRDDNGNAVSSGVYFYVLDAGKERLTRKLVLLK